MSIEDPDAGIDALFDAWRGAFAREDIDAILNLLTPDYGSLRRVPRSRSRVTSWRRGSAQLSARQRVILLLRRCADGHWRFARGMVQS